MTTSPHHVHKGLAGFAAVMVVFLAFVFYQGGWFTKTIVSQGPAPKFLAQAAPSSMTTATRTSGVAPLLVVFDPVDMASQGWSSGVVQPTDGDYASFYYTWNYGDGTSGTWSTDGKSKNADAGMIASHVYETPGTYTATLSILTPANQTYTYSQTITVSDFTGTTYYVASNGSDSNPGTDINAPLQTFDAGISKAGTNTRILFRRGDTFTSSYIHIITANGPGILGAYGSGANPVIQDSVAERDGILGIQGHDWRIMDLDFVGTTVGAQQTASAIQGNWNSWNGSSNQNLLLLRLTASAFRSVGLGWEGNVDSVGIVDCHVYNVYTNGLYIGGVHLALTGSTVEHVTLSHLVRVWQGVKTVLAHNILDTPGPTRHNIKLHGYSESQVASWGVLRTQYVQISDNKIIGIGTWSTAIGPQGGDVDERISDVIYERNRSSNGGTDVLVWAHNVTIRNNVFEQAMSMDGYAVSISRRGIEPAPDNVRVYNNTAYMLSNSSHESPVVLAIVGTEATNVVVQNNIIAAPNATSPPFIIEDPRPPFSTSVGINNLIATNSDFLNPSGGDYRLSASSAGIGTANPLAAVRDDYTGALRSSAPNLGAFDSGSGSGTPPPAPTTCTSFTYSSWGTCQSNNTQTRTVTASSPSGCTGGTPALSQSCTYTPPTCTSFTYSAWGLCQSDSTQTRTALTSSPSGCTGGSPVISQSCTYTPPAVNAPTCTSFTYSSWSTCAANSTQTRTALTSSPSGCTGGSPVTSQSCTYTPPVSSVPANTYISSAPNPFPLPANAQYYTPPTTPTTPGVTPQPKPIAQAPKPTTPEPKYQPVQYASPAKYTPPINQAPVSRPSGPLSQTLSLGSSGSEVSILQSFLISARYLKPQPMGVFDQTTQQAVQHFQVDYAASYPGKPDYGTVANRTQDVFNIFLARQGSSMNTVSVTQPISFWQMVKGWFGR